MTPTMMYFRKQSALYHSLLVGDFLLLIDAVLSLMLYYDRQGVGAVERDGLALGALVEALQPWSATDSFDLLQGSGGLPADPRTPTVEERACATHPSSSV